ncbi:hypothetical protein BDZ89DRAFT_1138714 [Hymenopellis radicata]|nr:hypothetical protein BDZ89DRAFT_1138714 [Hymenopellis radicata]
MMKKEHRCIDSYYDRKKAQEAVDLVIRERIIQNGHVLSNETDSLIKKSNVISSDGELTWRLVVEEEMTTMEHVFVLEGVLVKSMLPPIGNVTRTKPENLQQSVQISGLGAQEFDRAVDVVREAHIRFSKRLGTDIEPWTPSSFEDHVALDFANRYFESTSMGDKIDFDPGVDPKGVLSKLATERNLHHTDDNRVTFWDSNMQEDARQFDVIEPQALHVGDVIEVQFSFVLVPLRLDKGPRPGVKKPYKHRLRLKLRTIARMDSTMTEQAKRAKYAQEDKEKAKKKETVRKNDMKRKVGY